mgnify:FL=1
MSSISQTSAAGHESQNRQCTNHSDPLMRKVISFLHTQKATLPVAFLWWAMTGSNCRHSACKADALPAELIAHIRISLLCLISLFFSSALRCLSAPSCHLFKNIINRLDKSYYVRLYSC